MKYKILEKPNCEDAYDLVHEALRKRATILIYACCKIGNLQNQKQEVTLKMTIFS